MQTAQRSPGPCCILIILLATIALVGCSQSAEDAPENKGASTENEEASLDNGQGDSSPEQKKDWKHPVVEIKTSFGSLVVKLDGEKAELTVNNFLRYVHKGHYNGTIFHDVTPRYAIVGGTYTDDLTEKPTGILPVRNEAHNGLKNASGTIAMTRKPGVIDSATSGFFINLDNNSHMDHQGDTAEAYGYCVFGEVIEGLDIAKRIADAKVHKVAGKDGSPLERVPVEPVVIRSVRVIR